METIEKISVVFSQHPTLLPCLCHVESWRSSLSNECSTLDLLQRIANEWDALSGAQEKHLIDGHQWSLLQQLSELRTRLTWLLAGTDGRPERQAVAVLQDLQATMQFDSMSTLVQALSDIKLSMKGSAL